jgi:hypothetical protein
VCVCVCVCVCVRNAQEEESRWYFGGSYLNCSCFKHPNVFKSLLIVLCVSSLPLLISCCSTMNFGDSKITMPIITDVFVHPSHLESSIHLMIPTHCQLFVHISPFRAMRRHEAVGGDLQTLGFLKDQQWRQGSATISPCFFFFFFFFFLCVRHTHSGSKSLKEDLYIITIYHYIYIERVTKNRTY